MLSITSRQRTSTNANECPSASLYRRNPQPGIARIDSPLWGPPAQHQFCGPRHPRWKNDSHSVSEGLITSLALSVIRDRRMLDSPPELLARSSSAIKRPLPLTWCEPRRAERGGVLSPPPSLVLHPLSCCPHKVSPSGPAHNFISETGV